MFLFTSPLKLLGTDEFESELVVAWIFKRLVVVENFVTEWEAVEDEEICLGKTFAWGNVLDTDVGIKPRLFCRNDCPDGLLLSACVMVE